LVHVSLTVSPIVDSNGTILGASKIARDITAQHLAQERQQLLLREMNHRVKNLFAVTSSIVNLNARTAQSPQALAAAVTDRFAALGRAHALTMTDSSFHQEYHAMMRGLAEAILGPYEQEGRKRILISGTDFSVAARAITPLALLLHEFATNALKYGSLAHEAGRVEMTFSQSADEVNLVWRESGDATLAPEGEPGFGSRLVEATVSQLGGRMNRVWHEKGLSIELTLARNLVVAAEQ
jgi:two-component sensor histidine kinase